MTLHTKQDYQDLMFRLLNPLKPLYSAGCAQLVLGDFGVTYNQQSMALEAFSRPLWALVPFWVGGGSAPAFEAIYQTGLANGVNPTHPEFWGHCGAYDQRFVEMASIACGMLNAPEKIWEPLSDSAKNNLACWMDEINHHDIPSCNWRFFRVLVNLALNSVCMPCDLALMHQDLDLLDGYYKGDGWSTDGASPQKDYYIPWAIQYYSVLYSKFGAHTDPERAARYRQRAILFGQQFVLWFDKNGAALPFGRSLCYRFAQCSFWSACVYAGIEVFPLSVMKGLIARNFEWWLQQKMCDRDGVLTVGYCYPQMYMAERYNGPGGPYWGMKSFVHLALPDDHPFWGVQAEPLPRLAPLTPLYHADMLVQRLADGQVNAYAAGVNELYGHGQFPEKYSKFVYSTRFGFSASRSMQVLHQAAPDNMLAFEIDDNIFVRKVSKTHKVQADRIISTWVPFVGITVETEIIPTETGHIRRHLVQSDYDCTAYDCGFAVAHFVQGEVQALTEHSATAHTATAQNAMGGCSVTGAGTPKVILADPNTNLYHTNTNIPAIAYHIVKGETIIETKVVSWWNKSE